MATESSDFSLIVQSCFFVDKTLLIAELFSDALINKRFVKVGPGPHFAKSSNINMLKRYLEIVVNEKGNPINEKTTKNYKLFSENNLKINECTQVFDNHFGKYPIVHLNYKPLELVRNFQHLLVKYKEVLYHAFSEHKYLLEVNSVWMGEFNKTEFRKYLNLSKENELSKTEVIKGLTLLPKLLHRHFRQRAFVLVDDYDMIMDSPLSEKFRDEVFSVILQIEKELVDNNDDVFKVFFSGCHRRERIPGDEDPVLADELLWKYYGLSHDELIELLRKFIADNREVEVAANTVVDLYSGYVRDFESYELSSGVNYRTISVCSVWSVIQFFVCMRKSNITMI